MMLEVKHLGCELGGRAILKDVSLALRPGEIAVLLGPNGAGKSTLLHCLTGYQQVTKGEILVDGVSVAGLSAAKRAAYFSLLSQELSPTFPFQVVDFVLMGRVRYLGWFEAPSPQDRDMALAMLERVGAVHLQAQNVNTLSSGEKQRVLLARTLLQDAAILLLDEPTSHLDFASQYQFIELIRHSAVALGKGVLAVMHDPNLAIRLADRVILLHQGSCLAAGTPAEILTPDNLSTVFKIATRHHDVSGGFLVVPQ